MTESKVHILQALYDVIESRKGGDPETSYTARLLHGGREEIARKVAEESIEVVIAAINETPERLVSESADMLYHLLVLWAKVGIKPHQVWQALEGRQGTSGIAEKQSREKHL